MLSDIQSNAHAPWKMRFRAPVVEWSQVAKTKPSRGLAASNKSGIYQLYAWDVWAGVLRQLTDWPTGVLFGSIAPDGRHVYYLSDEQGNEIGHYVRVAWEGGEPEDISPALPSYSAVGFEISRVMNILGFLTATADGFAFYRQTIEPDGTLGSTFRLYQHERLAFGGQFSSDGSVAAISTVEEDIWHQELMLRFALRVLG
jgi:hypothetical protein